MELLELFNIQGTLFLMILVGALLKKLGIVDDEGRRCLTDLCINVVIPCNIVKSCLVGMEPGVLHACAVLLVVRGETAVYAAVGLTGFAMACVFATFYAVATKAVPEKANEVAGLMILAISAGAVSGPVCGAIVRWSGDAHWGMLFVALCVGYMLWASFKLKIKQ